MAVYNKAAAKFAKRVGAVRAPVAPKKGAIRRVVAKSITVPIADNTTFDQRRVLAQEKYGEGWERSFAQDEATRPDQQARVAAAQEKYGEGWEQGFATDKEEVPAKKESTPPPRVKAKADVVSDDVWASILGKKPDQAKAAEEAAKPKVAPPIVPEHLKFKQGAQASDSVTAQPTVTLGPSDDDLQKKGRKMRTGPKTILR